MYIHPNPFYAPFPKTKQKTQQAKKKIPKQNGTQNRFVIPQ